MIHRLVITAERGARLDASLLPPGMRAAADTAAPGVRTRRDILRAVELATISDRLRAHGYRRTATARSLGVTREGLWQELRQLALQLPARDIGADE